MQGGQRSETCIQVVVGGAVVALGGGVISTDSLRVITKNFSRAQNFCSKSRETRSAGQKSRFWSSNFHFSRIAPLFSQRNRIRFPLAEFLHGLKRQFSDQNRAKSTPRYSIYYSIYYNICIYHNILYNIYKYHEFPSFLIGKLTFETVQKLCQRKMDPISLRKKWCNARKVKI